MKTLCPTCKTRYDIDPKSLLEADGLARCFRCGTVFDAVAEDAPAPGATYSAPVRSAVTLDEQAQLRASDDRDAQATELRPDPGQPVEQEDIPASATAISDVPADGEFGTAGTDSTSPVSSPSDASVDDAEAASAPPPEAADAQLPFEVPDNLAPLEPSPDVAIDVVDTLYEKKSRRGLVYGLTAVMLLAGLGLQLAWQHRKDLLDQYPVLQPLCEYITCFPRLVQAPEKISVLQRDIKPATNQPDSLTLSATIRNDADTAQSLPDIQLSLLDNNGAVLIRRRLAPADYLFPTPPKEKILAAGEVITIALDFKDPGHQASGFVIDFL